MGRHHRPGEPLSGATADRPNNRIDPLRVVRSFDGETASPAAGHPGPLEPSEPVGVAEDDIRVLADDVLLDSLARLTQGAALGGLLAGWQQEVAAKPVVPPSVDLAARKLRRAQAHPVRAIIGVAAAVVTVLAGGAIVGSRLATPGDALWPVATVLWSDRVTSADASHEVAQALSDARTALSAGNAPSAVVALTRASGDLTRVQPVDGRDNLKHDYDDLLVQASSSMSTFAPTTEQTDGWLAAKSSGAPAATKASSPARAVGPGSTPNNLAAGPKSLPQVAAGVPVPVAGTGRSRPATAAAAEGAQPPSTATSHPGSTSAAPAPGLPTEPAVPTTGAGSSSSDPTPTTSSDPTTTDPTSTDPPTSSSSSDSPTSSSSESSTPSTPVTSQPSDTPTDPSTDSSTDVQTTETAPGGGGGTDQGDQGQVGPGGNDAGAVSPQGDGDTGN